LKNLKSELKVEEISIVFGVQESGGVLLQGESKDKLKLLPNTEAKIVDSSNQVVPYNTTGELLVKGFNIMKEYRNNKESTSQVIDSNGFLKTRVQAKVDKDGNYTIVEDTF